MIDKETKSFKDNMNMIFGNGVIVMVILLLQNYSKSDIERNLVTVLFPIGLSLFALHSIAGNFNRRLQRLEALQDPSRPMPPPPGPPSLFWIPVIGAAVGLIASLLWHTITWDQGYQGADRGPRDLPFFLTGLGLGAVFAIYLWQARRSKAPLD